MKEEGKSIGIHHFVHLALRSQSGSNKVTIDCTAHRLSQNIEGVDTGNNDTQTLLGLNTTKWALIFFFPQLLASLRMGKLANFFWGAVRQPTRFVPPQR